MNPWLEHLSKIRKANPKLSLKQAMIKAKASYKKGKSGGSRRKNETDTFMGGKKAPLRKGRGFLKDLYGDVKDVAGSLVSDISGIF